MARAVGFLSFLALCSVDATGDVMRVGLAWRGVGVKPFVGRWHPGAWPCQHWRLDGGGDLALSNSPPLLAVCFYGHPALGDLLVYVLA